MVGPFQLFAHDKPYKRVAELLRNALGTGHYLSPEGASAVTENLKRGDRDH